MEYNRIIYPERAEYLNEEKFSSYRIFLDHWNDLTNKLKSNFEESILRRVSKTLIVYGGQSSGKTLLARKLAQDIGITQKAIQTSRDALVYDSNNMWHRLVSGVGRSPELIQRNTGLTALIHIEDDKNWVKKSRDFCTGNTDRTCVIIADNCERDYFIQGLLQLTDQDFLQIGRTDALIKAAAQRFVALCRGELRGALITMFTNDDLFALAFEEAVNMQHSGLVEVSQIPLPGPKDKEAVIRVNTNRLNPFSYWYCLDRAGVEEKKRVFTSLRASTGFKDSFEAVDQAIQRATPTRMGRPPRKCLLTLFILTNVDNVQGLLDTLPFPNPEKTTNPNAAFDIASYKNDWSRPLGVETRSGLLLESEWNFRIILTGNHFTSLLLENSDPTLIKSFIDSSLTHHGPGTWATTFADYRTEMDSIATRILRVPLRDNTAFWSAGQVRSHDYERSLKAIYNSYNTSSQGFLQYRPDLIIEPYSPCAISSSPSSEDSAINDTIRRSAVVCEFTASKDFNITAIQTYMARKITNYIEVLQEQ